LTQATQEVANDMAGICHVIRRVRCVRCVRLETGLNGHALYSSGLLQERD